MRSDHSILLVEDDTNDVRLIERALRKAGMACPLHVVSDGEAAVDYLEGSGAFGDRNVHPLPTLVLLDLKLPRRSGFEVLDYVRGHPALGKTIVVVLTSSAQRADISRAYAAGANSYLVKPIKPAEVEDLMSRVKEYWLDSNRPPPVLTPLP